MRFLHEVLRRGRQVRRLAEHGMSTAEYAVGTVAPVGRISRGHRPVFTGLHWVLLGS
ncbi:MAG: DUF4244 domain-containing protein [Actinobacteria bacterium]|nr:DUF4244 domain-containing protein [Actinomycetota bacterium]